MIAEAIENFVMHISRSIELVTTVALVITRFLLMPGFYDSSSRYVSHIFVPILAFFVGNSSFSRTSSISS